MTLMCTLAPSALGELHRLAARRPFGDAEGLTTAAWVIALSAFFIFLVFRARALARSLRAKRRGRRAVIGEREAQALLRRAGYHVRETQLRTHHPVMIDGQTTRFEVRADIIATRGPQRYVVEVKTGKEAPSLSMAATRRQLLEYAVTFDADGLLLVNAETRSIHRVTFPRLRAGSRSRTSRVRAFAFGGLCGLGMGALAVAWTFGLLR